MIYPKIPLAQSIIQICLAKGITNIVISPGSRNAPLTIGFVSDPNFKCYSIADERCAAFFAMGIAQQIQRPVVVVCTSGSALLNYYPAVAEAFYSQIPLIVISADRPTEKIDIGDGQTIRQQNVYLNHSLYNANLKNDTVSERENDKKINEAINTALLQKGPVHINAPFEEPLYDVVSELAVYPFIIPVQEEQKTVSVSELSSFVESWNKATKKMILVGVNEPGQIDREIIDHLAKDPSVVVMTETTSNLYHPSFLNNIDTIITPFTLKDFETLQPEILVTFGGMIVSKRVKAFLRNYKPQQHWHIDTLRAYDTYQCLSKHFVVTPQSFFKTFLPMTTFIKSNYKTNLEAINRVRREKHDQYLASVPFSDFKVFEKILSDLPKGSQLQLSNSSTIRYAQLFDIDPSVEVFCNRGTSGIDGSSSTAVGAAVVNGKQTILITGDISFFYDSNALWNSYIPKNFKIILINNGGGGIFRILPGHKESPVFNTYFETSHHHTAEYLAKMFRFSYYTAHNEEDIKMVLEVFYKEEQQPAIFEIFTPTKINNDILINYFKGLS